MTRTAILVSGHARTYATMPLRASFARLTQQFSPCDVYVHLWRTPELDEETMLRAFKPFRWLIDEDPSAADERVGEWTHAQRHQSQREGLRRVWQLLDDERYDVIVRHRPDCETLIVGTPLPCGRAVHVGDRKRGTYDSFICDAHAYGPYDLMREYFSPMRVPRDGVVPEAALAAHLKWRGVPVCVLQEYGRRLHRRGEALCLGTVEWGTLVRKSGMIHRRPK